MKWVMTAALLIGFQVAFVAPSFAEDVWVLEFRVLGWDETHYTKFQVLVGETGPIFSVPIGFPNIGTVTKPYWSQPVRMDLPAYDSEPISFRITGSNSAVAWRVFIADIRLTRNARQVDLGSWHYNETYPGFQGYIGEGNLLLEHPVFGGDARGYAEFVSDKPRDAADLAIGYRDVTLTDINGVEKKPFEVKPGETVRIRAEVHNLGTLDAVDVQIGLYDVNWSILGSEVKFIPSGESSEVEFDWTAPKQQRSTLLRVAADYYDVISEADEHNNHVNRFITGPHPYLLFYGEEMPKLRQKITEEEKVKAWWHTVRTSAEAMLFSDFKNPDAGVSRPRSAAHLAFTYLMEGDEEYAAKAKEALLYMDPYHFVFDYTSISFVRYYGWAYDFLFPYLETHDAEDANRNDESDLLEIQRKLANLSVIICAGAGKNRGVTFDRPPDFGLYYWTTGEDRRCGPQERGWIGSNVGTLALSLMGFDERLEARNDAIGVFSSYDGVDHLANFILSDLLGFPDSSPWGNTSYHNGENIPSCLGAMCGRGGKYEEGTYYLGSSYWRQGFASLLNACDHLGLDIGSLSYIRSIIEFNIRAMAPDRTGPLYYHSMRQPFRSAMEVASLCKDGTGRACIWYWKETGEESYGEIDPITKIVAFDRELYDEVMPPDIYFDSPSQFMPESGMAVLRSDWSEDGTYMMILGEHRLGGLYTSHDEGDATSFNLFAKGEYLVLECCDGRFSQGNLRLEGGDYAAADDVEAWAYPWDARRDHEKMVEGPAGHNLILIDELTTGGSQNVPGDVQSYRIQVDKAYIENDIDTDSFDYLEVRLHEGDLKGYMSDIRTVDIDNTRSVLFPDQEYFIIHDSLRSLNGREHSYGFQLHLAGRPIETDTFVVPNWQEEPWRLKKMDGNLTVDGVEVIWDDADMNTISNATELVWRTRNQKDEEIALKVFFLAPMVDISVERGDGDAYYTRYNDPYINPYVRASVVGSDVDYLVVLYPWKVGVEVEPVVECLHGSGIVGAGRITKGTITDIVALRGESQSMTVDSLEAEARIAYCHLDGSNLTGFMVADGRELIYEGRRYIWSDRNVTGAFRYSPDALEGYVISQRNAMLRIYTGRIPEHVFLDGDPVNFVFDGETGLTTFTVTGRNRLNVSFQSAADITVTVSETSIIKGGTIGVSGIITPSKPGVRVTLTYIRPDGSTLERETFTSANGTYLDTCRPDEVGDWVVTAGWEEDDTSATSIPVTFTVAASGHTARIFVVVVAIGIVAMVCLYTYKKR